MKVFWIALMSIAVTFGSLFGQNGQAKLVERYEFDMKEEGENISNFAVYTLKNKGLINVYSHMESNRNTVWVFKMMDKNLKVKKEESIEISRKLYFQSKYTTKTHLHVLFRTKKKDYMVISLNLSTMKLTEVEGEFPAKVYFNKMKVIGDYAVLDTKSKREVFLSLINWKTGRTKIIPININGVKPKRIFFENFQVLEGEKELFAFISARIDKKVETFALKLDHRGNKKEMFSLTKKYENVVSGISVSKIGDGEYIYTGTYSKKNSSVSNGLFIGKSTNGKVNFIESYNFLELNNFLTYLPAKKQKRIEKKKKRKARRGKELTYNYLIACHDIIKKGDKYILLGEAYFPTYRSEARTTYVNGQASTTYVQVFDGYRYTHAVIIGFDKEGKLVWDNTFKMYPSYKPYYVKKFISISEANDKEISMIFSSGSAIYMKTLDNFNGKTTKEENTDVIVSEDEEDVARWSTSETDYWYDRSFVTYGYQKIKNKSGKKKRKRKVYYINKIEY